MVVHERFSGIVYFGRFVDVGEALSAMHTSLDPDYIGKAVEYVPGKGDFGLPRVGTDGLAQIYFCQAPPSLRYSNLSSEAKARLDKAMGNGRGK